MVEKFKGMRIDEILESLARGTKPVTSKYSNTTAQYGSYNRHHQLTQD